jgi:phage shock protein A
LESDDKDDAGPTLLSLEDQISLQETVQGLLEENKKLKKKVTDVEATATSKTAAPTLKKMKNKVGGVRAKKEVHIEEPEKPLGGAVKSEKFAAAASESSNRSSAAMDLGDLYSGQTVSS